MRNRSLERQFNAGVDRLLARRLQQQRAVVPHAMRQALDIHTGIVVDPVIGERLAARHNSHVLSSEIAAHAYGAMSEKSPEHFNYFKQLRSQTKEHGLFVYPYTKEFEEQRITGRYADGSPKFLIVESFGRPEDPSHPRHAEISPAADAQFQLAQPSGDAATVITWPKKRANRKQRRNRDQILDEDLVDEMKSMPYAVAVLDDLSSDPDMGHMRLAASAMNRGIHHINRELNATRGDFPIRFIAAEIVSVQGFVTKGGQVVRLQSDLQITPILNDRSMAVFDHFNSPDCESFTTAWIRRGSLVPVDHPHVSNILVDWHVKVARLKAA